MRDYAVFAEDDEGCLRRWLPTPVCEVAEVRRLLRAANVAIKMMPEGFARDDLIAAVDAVADAWQRPVFAKAPAPSPLPAPPEAKP